MSVGVGQDPEVAREQDLQDPAAWPKVLAGNPRSAEHLELQK